MSNPKNPAPASVPRPPALRQQQQARLATYAKANYNFDLDRINEYNAANGWRIDNYETTLPAEAPGPPAPHGSWLAAQQVLLNYTFPPPDLITGIFAPDAPLENRTMLLRGRFLFFTFWFGVRTGKVTDETRNTPAGPEQVWGYSYSTLEGHFERGRIEFTIHKQLDSGQVTFQIHAVSQVGRIRNPFYWLGFKLFGRMLQRRFARESLRRMQDQVAAALRKQPSAA